MDASEFTATLRGETSTELDRLGSEKALVAATTARLDTDAVVVAAARTEARATDTFEQWAESESDANAREAFERVASEEREHYERIVERLDDSEAPDAADADALHDYLRGLDDPIERVAAGMVARPMVASRSLLQTVNFFVNEAAESTADLFREVRTETDAMVDDGVELLETLCEDEEDWERAERAAIETIERAYETYVDSLDELGIDPKPVC